MDKSKRKRLLAVAALCLVAVLATTAAAYAYFSDYDIRGGSLELSLSPRTEIEEEPTDTSKTIVIRNTSSAGGASVVVRMFIYGPDGMTIDAGDGWVKSGDCWYYNKILKAGEETSSMLASIEGIEPTVDLKSLDIIVVHESSAVAYDDNGQVYAPAGWSGFPVIMHE